MLRNIFWQVGVLGPYRRVFWKFALGRLRHGDLEGLIGSVLIGHHLIMFARAASSGRAERVELFDPAARGLRSCRMTTAGVSPTLDLQTLTPARVALGRAGASLPTRALLDFTLDHARARDAVHAAFDASSLIAQLADLGIAASEVHSRAGNRRDYLRRPDLGRRLDETSAEQLAGGEASACRLAIVIGDGLSPRPCRRMRWN